MSPIAYRSYQLDDYLADTAGWNVVQTVHVECGLPPKDQLSENRLAAGPGPTRGVIGGHRRRRSTWTIRMWNPLLEAHAARANVRGVRQIVDWQARTPAKTYGPDRPAAERPVAAG